MSDGKSLNVRGINVEMAQQVLFGVFGDGEEGVGLFDLLFCACYEVPKATFWSKPGWFNKKRQIMNEEGVRYPRFSNHFQVGEEEDVVVRGGEAVEAREIDEGGEGDEFVGDGKMCGC